LSLFLTQALNGLQLGILLFLLAQKEFVQGLTTGATKG